jgi:hypothetical protein
MSDKSGSNASDRNEKTHLTGPAGFLGRIFGSRFAVFFMDYIYLKLDLGLRGKQLSREHMLCRFCGEPIHLVGAWKCGCGHKRPGRYFGRCPSCLQYPKYIDCPVCGFSMDVR